MRVLIISDVHANLVALEAVLRAAPSVDAIWNLGDTVGYGPRPVACLNRLGDETVEHSLVGNHDLAAIGQLDLSEFNPWARAAALWTSEQLLASHRERLAALPATVVAAGVTLAHGSPRDPIWEYVADRETASANFVHFETAWCLVGHTHVARIDWQLGPASPSRGRRFRPDDVIDVSQGKWLLNPGSVGQPRDRDPRASYAVLDTGRGTVTNYREEYDVAQTQRQMAESALPVPLIARLALGH
ncbi:MAG: metallophosphatase family protein [Chloroflexota bacterium]|nr:metallophosphatase family protein [Chloroflexota bacterium]